MSFVLDEQAWPIVVITFKGASTDAELESVFDRIDQYLSTEKEYVAICDLREAEALSHSQRSFTGNWLKSRKERLRRTNLGSAFVFSSAIFRFMLSGIFLVQPLPSPHLITGELEEAMQWANSLLWRKSSSGMRG